MSHRCGDRARHDKKKKRQRVRREKNRALAIAIKQPPVPTEDPKS